MSDLRTDATVSLTCELVRRPSVTPADHGCQQLIAKRLAAAGFEIEHLRFGEVDNLWAHRGTQSPTLCFAGHTDVVPTGPREAWTSDPFEPELRDGLLYGRGAADMKGSVAAMVVACEQFAREQPEHRGSLALLLTSDEEGPALDGTDRVVQLLAQRGQLPDWCVVGEPSCHQQLGDVVRIGRRGSLNGQLTVHGVQGHVAYPHLASNPIHTVLPALSQLTQTVWDEGNAQFPPTSFQISNVNSGTGASNVIPSRLQALFNFRHSTQWGAEQLRERVHSTLQAHGLEDYTIDWLRPSPPFLSQPGPLRDAIGAAIKQACAMQPDFNTKGGTSDGRFIAPLGVEVVEFGPVNASIHQVDEHVRAADLPRLAGIYQQLMRALL